MHLGTVRDRAKLKPRREPYWHKLATGQFLGYRPSKVGTKSGSWIARYYDPDTQKHSLKSLGDFGSRPANERFTAAQTEARAWFDHLIGGGTNEVLTVEDACRRYEKSRLRAGRELRYVYNDPLAKVKLPRLTDRHLRDWRTRIEEAPARRRGKRGEIGTTVEPERRRAPSTVKRIMAPLRAALNRAYEQGNVLTNRAWRGALKPAEYTNRRTLYLDKNQRRRLLQHAPEAAAAFVRVLCLLPLRPGAAAQLRVKDFDARTRELRVREDKANAGRVIVVPPETAALLEAQSKDKLPAAFLFTRADGRNWESIGWGRAMQVAREAADLPSTTTAYTLRHSTITDLVVDGLDLLTVARLSGTSVMMIERHYGHLRHDHAAQALAALAL